MAKGTPLLEKGYKGMVWGLSEEKKPELIMRKHGKSWFCENSGDISVILFLLDMQIFMFRQKLKTC